MTPDQVIINIINGFYAQTNFTGAVNFDFDLGIDQNGKIVDGHVK